jgi:hypothetical protein
VLVVLRCNDLQLELELRVLTRLLGCLDGGLEALEVVLALGDEGVAAVLGRGDIRIDRSFDNRPLNVLHCHCSELPSAVSQRSS